METRQKELLEIKSQIDDVDAVLSKILQHLHWDRSHLLESCPKVICKYDTNHKVSQECKERHESQCRLAHNNYVKEDKMLPDPLDCNSKTLIRLNKDDIRQIITQAAKADPSLKRENDEIEPQTFGRLQCTYSGDERRAIYDAVVQAAPFCHDLSDLALLSEQEHAGASRKAKSRVEVLAELRDMKRRRTKYRVAAKTTNYSDVLRDVIKTQMEVYTGVKMEKTEANTSNGKRKDDIKTENTYPPRPSRSESRRPVSLVTEYDKYNKHKREHSRKRECSRSTYEDRPSTSKKTRYDDEFDSKDRRHEDKRGKDRHLIRDSSKYDYKRRDSPDHRNYQKRDEDRYSKDYQRDERNNESMHRRDKYSSSRVNNEERYESKSYYSGHKQVSRKDKKKYEYTK